nr:hypothetical protein CFP56_53622 [Quercus suber]
MLEAPEVQLQPWWRRHDATHRSGADFGDRRMNAEVSLISSIHYLILAAIGDFTKLLDNATEHFHHRNHRQLLDKLGAYPISLRKRASRTHTLRTSFSVLMSVVT